MLMDDLLWLGLEWDEGPRVGGPNGPYWQSQRGDFYEKALQELCQRGLVYPCTCTRADIMATQAPHESDGRVVYKGTCRPADSICWESVLAGDKNRDERQHGMKEDKICLHQPAALRLMVPPQPLADIMARYVRIWPRIAETLSCAGVMVPGLISWLWWWMMLTWV